jgi:hypothetical protein
MSLVKKPRRAVGFAPYPLAGLAGLGGVMGAAQLAAQQAARQQTVNLIRPESILAPGEDATDEAMARQNYLLAGNQNLGLQFRPDVEPGAGLLTGPLAKAGTSAAQEAAKAGAAVASVPPADREAYLRWYGNVTGVPQKADAGGGVTTTVSKLRWFGEARQRAARLIEGGAKSVSNIVGVDPLPPAALFLAWKKTDPHGLAAYDSLVTPNGPQRKAVGGLMSGGPGVGGWPFYGPKRLVEYWFAAVAEERKLVASRAQAAANVASRGLPRELLGYASTEQNLHVDVDVGGGGGGEGWSGPVILGGGFPGGGGGQDVLPDEQPQGVSPLLLLAGAALVGSVLYLVLRKKD